MLKTTPEASSALLTFTLGGQVYALPIDDVVEVAAMVEMVHVVDALPQVLGVVNRRGTILPMLDLRRVFDKPAPPVTSATLFIVAVNDGRLVGLVVDEVQQVVYVDARQKAPTSGKYIRGIIIHKEQLIQIIALPTIMAAFLEDEAALEGNS